ncbi:acyl-CoA dehydrogenase [Mycobacterium kubicae]|uniref:Acyl-[acyl-carrier-protein] dehydrogenase MbtN n=1 Tax=Mycobacterium kubicae TaxID=120959 RepID=A0AAX1JAV8_9MYCO|nr:acyl-CoA dehydrogenase family protein [Mycobacterium kubicae]MCV7098062.1 acyl-CoA dehydrogenase family protein [Mycobacterium kubicae]ORW05603.1 acyl-CoA dehydrogenase [Mycobacterium kubicae]QNI14595.1 acyl-CoA dehydrogenase [Mycobacterium kubicae]QPI38634.1 acyl-CoA dehydrogenase family protein [Mycobacterium kubicae]GFG63536.1 acyl-CoA dehydrogenase [Mycobacterium kubicae]
MADRLEYTSEHRQFRELVREFVQQTVVPAHEQWERDGQWDRSLFIEAGKLGLLGFSVPEQFGGPGVNDFRYNAIVIDELQRGGAASEAIAFTLQNDVVLPYLTDLTTPEQQQRWLPGVVTGETVLGIGMTEPGAGSDLAGIRTTAVRDGDHYLVNGAKTFISNGQSGDLFVIAARTSPDRHKGLTLLVVEGDTPGFERGRNLEKIGLHAQDTSELSFTDMRVPAANLLGSEGDGFYQLVRNLPQERLALGVGAVAAAESILAETLDYVRDRKAFGSPIASFQNSQFVLAELATEIDVARTYLDDCLAQHLVGELTAARAARLKWWTTDLQVRTADRCLQLHGGYGYMREYRVSRAFVDARIQTIYGGTNEIMKTIIAKELGI